MLITKTSSHTGQVLVAELHRRKTVLEGVFLPLAGYPPKKVLRQDLLINCLLGKRSQKSPTG